MSMLLKVVGVLAVLCYHSYTKMYCRRVVSGSFVELTSEHILTNKE
jgi:Tfp pilus assembly protein PilE